MNTTTEVKTPGFDAALDFFRDPLPGSDSPIIRFVDWILRGTSQVVFQSNWLTGLLILIAIGVNSPIYMTMAIIGCAVSTLTAVVLKMDRGLIDVGLLGFNGVLVAIGLNAYMAEDFVAGAWPSPELWLYIIISAAFSTVIFSALGSLLGSRAVPALTAPFVFAAWIFIFAVPHFTGIEAGPLLAPGIPEMAADAGSYTGTVWFEGIFKGIGEIFFQDNWITGLIMAIAILLNTRIGGIMAILGSTIGVAVSILFGASAGDVGLGLYGFNAALTAIALGGFFFAFNGAGILYALFGTVTTVVAWSTIAIALAPIGMPTFTFPFVLITWFFILAKPGFAALKPIAPPDATYPEDNLRRVKAGQL